jgi:hypothetical protein
MKTPFKISKRFAIIISIVAFCFPAAFAAEAQPLINEIMASNTTTLMDQDGDYSDWIEIYNPSDTRINLSGYGLSDRPENPYKWIFPDEWSLPDIILEPKEYLIVFASGKDRPNRFSSPHTNFKISSDGETLVLTDPDGALCDSVYTKIESTDISMGRMTGTGEEWFLFLEPTPGEINAVDGYQDYSNAVVEMSIPGGFYDSNITLDLSTISENAEIRYTVDGSEPTQSSILYTSAVSIDTTTVVRARIFEGNMFLGSINTQTYFIDVAKNLPVISLSTDPDNYFDDDIGIYVEGIDKSFVYYNYKQDWERPVHIELYETNGSRGFSIDCGVKISGFMIRDHAQKPFALFARPKYGYSKIDYQIFPDLPITEFKSITLRNGGNEFYAVGLTRFRDSLCHSLVKNTNIDIMAFSPAKVFLNGVYWGHYNIREKQNEDYLASHHNIDPDNVDMLEFTAGPDLKPFLSVIEGDSLHYKAMEHYIVNNDMSDPANYEYIKTQMDIENFIDYNIAEMYLANVNWSAHNVKFWRPRTPNGKWRWILCDLDWGLTYPEAKMFEPSSDSKIFFGEQYMALLFNLLDNKEFKYNLLNRFGDYINTIFSPDIVIQRMNEIKALLEPGMQNHITRWKDREIVLNEKIESMDDWNSSIARIEEFAVQRPDSVLTQIIDHFNLSGTANVSLSVSSPEGGQIQLNSILPNSYPWSGIYFKDVPIQLTALPNIGYRFVGWEGVAIGDSISSTITLSDSISVTAVFEKIGANALVIDKSQSPYRIAGIQSVQAGASLTIEAGVELLMSANASINISGEIHMNGTPENPITISAEGGRNWNGIFLDNASGSSTISNVIISGASTWENPEGFPAAISGLNSEVTIDNVRFENCRQSIFAQGGSVTVTNCFFADSNKHEPINIKNAEATVENCRFENVFFEDAIDYDGITGGIIRNNEIFGTVDSDGDGIDIGDDCVNVLVTGNLIYDCADKGISIGEGAKDIRVERSIIAGCLYGIAVKDSATAIIDHCTIYGNNYAVAAYEKGGRRFGGGTAVITNSILAKSNISTLFTDELSEIAVSYTMCDSEILDGGGNLMADPMLAIPGGKVFDVMPGSPALTADSNGAEVGAVPYRELISNVVINEINYSSSEDFNPGDWVELYNITENTVDISGWVFKDDDDAHSFEIPANTVLGPYAYLVLCCEDSLFTNEFPDMSRFVGSFGFGLNAAGEALRLYDADGGLADWVVYDDADPWPVEPDGTGSTLALIDPEQDNIHAANWLASAENGTPGWVNDVANAIDEDEELENPIAFSLGQNYPNPFNPVTTIPFEVPVSGKVTLDIYSITGQRIANILDKILTAGHHQAVFRADHLPSGMYFYRIKAGGFGETKSMLLLK